MRRLLLKLRRRRTMERDLEAELALHRELATAHGHATPFGNTARLMEESRDLWRFPVEDLWRDVRYAARSLLGAPGFTVYALLALVVGIGLNIAVFAGFTAAVMRQPGGVRDPERLINFEDRDSYGPTYFTLPEYQQLRVDLRTVSGIAMESSSTTVLNDRDRSINLVTINFFELLGVPMAAGRGFTADENRPEAPVAVVVMAHSLWQSEYGADPDIVGRQISLGRVPFRVVGITDRAFDRGELWAPLASVSLVDPDRATEMAEGEPCCQLTARLSPGITRRQAQAELDVVASRIRSARATRDATELRPVTLRNSGGSEQLVRGLFPIFLVVQLTVGTILLLACANVGNLVLARGLARHREMAVRLSLGAGRLRIVRQLLVENLLLTGTASAVAVWVVYALLPSSVMSLATKVWHDTAIVGFGLVLALLATVVCGLAPALRATRVSLSDSMKQQSAQATRPLTLRNVLLGTQVALSVALLVCAALLVRGLYHVSTVDLGFRSDGVSALTIQLPWKTYQDRERAFLGELRLQLAHMGPVGIGDGAPPYVARFQQPVTIPTRAMRHAEPVSVARAVADAGYFDALGIPIVAGRTLVPDDVDRHNIVINETMARKYWPGTNPIGRAVVSVRSYRRPDGAWILNNEIPATIVGIVRDAQLAGPGRIQPTLFEPPAGATSFTVLVNDRMAGPAAATVRRLEPRATVSTTRVSQRLEGFRRQAQIIATYASALGTLALVLATIGVYGAFSYSVEQRRREVGIRLALGATAGGIVGMIVRRDLRPVLGGLAVGLALSLAASKALESQLYGVNRLDGLAHLGALMVLFLAGLAASALPARRAASIDPAKALYAE